MYRMCTIHPYNKSMTDLCLVWIIDTHYHLASSSFFFLSFNCHLFCSSVSFLVSVAMVARRCVHWIVLTKMAWHSNGCTSICQIRFWNWMTMTIAQAWYVRQCFMTMDGRTKQLMSVAFGSGKVDRLLEFYFYLLNNRTFKWWLSANHY